MVEPMQTPNTKRKHTGTQIPLPEVPDNVEVIRDVSFGDHERQSYDVYLPMDAARPLPVVVFFHPGAWTRRDKRAVRLMFLLGRGFAIVSIGYRLAQHAKFPAQIQDANAGLMHLLEHANDYGIDPDRLVLAGTSAGANLASLVALARQNPEFNPIPELAHRGVVAIYGSYDAEMMVNNPEGAEIDHDGAESPLGQLFGAPPSQRPDMLKAISPVTYVDGPTVPYLLLHGRDDMVLPWRQSAAFAHALIEAGTEVTLKVVPGAGHGSDVFRTPPISEEIISFISRVTDVGIITG